LIFRLKPEATPAIVSQALRPANMKHAGLRNHDSIEAWLFELANRRVLKSMASQLDDTIPARRRTESPSRSF
jgi:hypothetical protein